MMIAHHEELQRELGERVVAVTAAVRAGDDADGVRTALNDFVAGEVIPHALAEEDAIYRAGAELRDQASLVAGMILEHHTLVDLASEIAGSATDFETALAAAAFQELFVVHVRKENELLLPALVAAGTDPAALLATMQQAFRTRKEQAAANGATEASHANDGENVVDTRVPGAGSCASLANAAVDALAPGGSFVLIADHDPRGIRYMLQAERPGSTTWQVLEDGPERWQARIGLAPQPA